MQSGTQLHANFNLNKNGEEIILSNGKSLVLDKVSFLKQDEDESTGRCPDGSGQFATLNYPSYQLPNCVVGVDELEQNRFDFVLFPNPGAYQFSIKTFNKDENFIKISSSVGQVIMECTFDNSLQINSANWPNGIYFVTCNGNTKKLIINK